jgi:hypothetical protein
MKTRYKVLIGSIIGFIVLSIIGLPTYGYGPYAYLRIGKRGTSNYCMEIWPIIELTSDTTKRRKEKIR